jgi:putative endonuclease
MFWVYIAKNKQNNLYIGSTSDLKRRIKEHNEGKNKSTKPYLPWVVIYLEGYFSKEDALRREHNLKYFGKAYSQLKGRIKNSLRGA